MTLTERLVNALPPVDIVEFFDKAEIFSTKFLFFYAPVIACILLGIKGIQFLFRGLRLLNMTKNGKYFRGKVIGKHREDGEFYETGRLFLFTYPIVQYKRMGELHTCIANKPKKIKVGEVLSVCVCPDGDEHLPAPAICTMIWGLSLIIFALIGISFMYNSFNIFA